MQAVHKLLNQGDTDVVDADLSGDFDTLPHAELRPCVARRVSDKALRPLVQLGRDAPVEETDRRGHVHRTTRNKDEGQGTPHGAPLSPWLANLSLRRFVLGWKTWGPAPRLQAHLVNYAADFVICCKGTAEHALSTMRSMLSRIKLTVPEKKTKRCRVPAETFDFLGSTFGRCDPSRGPN